MGRGGGKECTRERAESSICLEVEGKVKIKQLTIGFLARFLETGRFVRLKNQEVPVRSRDTGERVVSSRGIDGFSIDGCRRQQTLFWVFVLTASCPIDENEDCA